MKISKVESFHTEDVGIVRVTMADGSQGLGQVSTYNADISVEVMHRQVVPYFKDREINDIDDIADGVALVLERQHKFLGSYLYRALCGVETALWDWLGKSRNKSVCELLGGTPRPLRVYASSMKRNITPEQEAERFLRLRDRHGYDAFKFRVGAECGRNQDEWPGRTETIIPTIRRALGPDVDLLADANSCFNPERAIEVGHLLEDNGIRHFEEPCPYWEMDWTRKVTAALTLDVTGGEQDHYLPAWQKMIDDRVVDVLQPDICYMGGITRTLQVVEMARKAGRIVTPHTANLSLVTIFTLHLQGAIDNAGPYLEFSIEEDDYYPWQYGIYENFPVAKDGKVTIPDEPGWGIRVRQDWLQSTHYRASELS
ncbi:mandelate racemase/muconate lactonizing enzyme family protein [Vreelandella arcis]|uniref:L-alanine-DL-glutamate epimerase n=1 Tax=Vreelandella arcis TaxID=416873 RepID=A0A1G9XPY9_9GAMM|nr:mandelate racemase/muconate lactonizing enzyme family protein [Halomonas arcis]SDM98834.1 L-alanine-DL-glutamate epimerase [Halomonas arcis]